jgi:hypothetical protein
MLPRTPGVTRIALLACTLLPTAPACADRKRERTEPPATEGTGSTGSGSTTGAGGQCVAGGPSVSIDIRGRAGGDEMPNDELGVLLGWIGGFAQPCRQATPEAPQFTLEIEIGAAGEKPTLVLVDREALPGLAACIDETFAKAAPPPPGPMKVDIVIPWGCPTLGPNFQEKSAKTEAPAAEPPP